MSATAVVERARVSRKTFYDFFDGREDCFMAVLDDAFAQISELVAPAYEQQGDWAERIRAAVVALLAYLEREPDTGVLALAYMLGQGPPIPEPRELVLARLCGAVESGRSRAASPRRFQATPLAAEMVIGGVLAVIHRRLQLSRRDLSGLANELTWMLVLPYRGAAAADRELRRTTPPPKRATRAQAQAGKRDPLRELNIRLTFRTAIVLGVIAATPGASNIEVSERAGVSDQGQISKLLGRLAHLGLIENTGEGQPRGAANAWHLTELGRRLEAATGWPQARAAARRG